MRKNPRVHHPLLWPGGGLEDRSLLLQHIVKKLKPVIQEQASFVRSPMDCMPSNQFTEWRFLRYGLEELI